MGEGDWNYSVWKYGKWDFPHYHTERTAFFSYRSVAMRKRKKLAKMRNAGWKMD